MSILKKGRPRAYGAEPLEQRLLLSTISGVKWRDVNGDGVRDPRTDTPLTGWTIYADLNNDGYREIIIGAPGTHRIYIIIGGTYLSGTYDLSQSPPILAMAWLTAWTGRS